MSPLVNSAALALLLTAASAAFGRFDDGWVALFDGKTLDGWQQQNGTAKYTVEDGCVVGRTEVGSPNSFMCTEKSTATSS